MGRPSKLKNSSEDIQNTVINLYLQGYSHNYIADNLVATGFKIDARSVNRFIESELGKQDKKINSDYQFAKNKSEFSETKTGQDVKTNIVIVDLDKLKSELNLPSDLSKSENIATAYQRISYEVFMLESAISIEKLKAHCRGECKHPNEALKGYKIASDVLSKAWSTDNIVDVNQALKTLESYYGDLSHLKMIDVS